MEQLHPAAWTGKAESDVSFPYLTRAVLTRSGNNCAFPATTCSLAHLGLTADALKVVGGSAVGLLGAFGFGTLSRRSERIKKKQRQIQEEGK